jgi:hypothetical protein
MISPEQGAKTTLHCATAPQLSAETGMYYEDCKVKASSSVAQDIALAEQLWMQSSKWVQI